MDNQTIYNQKIKVVQNDNQIILTKDQLHITYHLADGKFDVECLGNTFQLSNISSEVKLEDETYLTSKNGNRTNKDSVAVKQITDGFGEGIKLSVRSEEYSTSIDSFGFMEQNFYVYTSKEYIILETVVSKEDIIKTNYIAPLVVGEVKSNHSGDNRFLSVPFDNDDFVRYSSLPISEAKESYEVTTVFDNDTRKGFVVGSVTHDTWKTGIKPVGSGFTVFSGITSKLTRDILPHGFVKGKKVSSSKVFLGFYDDYRDGLEEYGSANGIIAPPLPWDKGIPMGWNSWSAVAKDINYDIYTNSSDFLKNNLQNNSFSADGIVFINFDAGWGRLTEEQLIKAAKHVKANGQIPGIYTTPFTFWGGNKPTGTVNGTDGKYTWEEVLLKDEEGNVLPPLDSGYSIDPTHPGNIMRIKHDFNKFRDWGYQYVKLDFMTHGAVEGVHYNKDITTGIAAYNYGMQQIVDIMKDEIEKQEFFISLSIAPLFPSQYAHSRRISCDIFGTINFAEYMLNSLAYGWWMNKSVYRFNDPDHIVVYNSYNHLDPILYNEGLTRYISSAIAGTMMIDSDDFRIEASRDRVKEILTNDEINEVAKAGISFRPVEGNTGDRACDCFIRRDEKENVTYLAVFNFSSNEKKEFVLDVSRIGLDPNKTYEMYDLWSKNKEVMKSKISVTLEEAEPKLYKITTKN